MVALKLFRMIFWCRQKRILRVITLPASNVVLCAGPPCDMSGTFKLGQALLILLCMSSLAGKRQKKKNIPSGVKGNVLSLWRFPLKTFRLDAGAGDLQRERTRGYVALSDIRGKKRSHQIMDYWMCISFAFHKSWAVNLHVSRHAVSCCVLWGDCK